MKTGSFWFCRLFSIFGDTCHLWLLTVPLSTNQAKYCNIGAHLITTTISWPKMHLSYCIYHIDKQSWTTCGRSNFISDREKDNLRLQRWYIHSTINGNTRVSSTVWPFLICIKSGKLEDKRAFFWDNCPMIYPIFIRVCFGMVWWSNVAWRCIKWTIYAPNLSTKGSTCK